MSHFVWLQSRGLHNSSCKGKWNNRFWSWVGVVKWIHTIHIKYNRTKKKKTKKQKNCASLDWLWTPKKKKKKAGASIYQACCCSWTVQFPFSFMNQCYKVCEKSCHFTYISREIRFCLINLSNPIRPSHVIVPSFISMTCLLPLKQNDYGLHLTLPFDIKIVLVLISTKITHARCLDTKKLPKYPIGYFSFTSCCLM